MRISPWFLAYIFLLIVYAVEGIDIKTCDHSIQIKCTQYQIIILSFNTTSRLATDILTQCNSHQQCNVTNTQKECIQVSYYCKMEVDIVHISESSDLDQDGKLPIFSIMSHGYQAGSFTEAENINCKLRLKDERNDTTRQMQVTINELTYSANLTDFCLYVNTAPACSSSGKLHESHGQFQSNNGWEIRMELLKSTSYIPQIRFWIDIHISPYEKDLKYHLKCNPYSVSSTSKNKPPLNGAKAINSTVLIIAVVLGILLLPAVLVPVIRTFWVHRKKKEMFSYVPGVYTEREYHAQERETTREMVGEDEHPDSVNYETVITDNTVYGLAVTGTEVISNTMHDFEVDERVIIDNTVYGLGVAMMEGQFVGNRAMPIEEEQGNSYTVVANINQ